MRFWDASAVVPLLVAEGGTGRAETLYREDPHVCVWWGTLVESASAVARRERDGTLDLATSAAILGRLVLLAGRWDEIQPGERLRQDALRLLRVHPLRAADSLQLAAALALCRGRPAGFPFVCADDRLSAAASREGFAVLGIGDGGEA